MEATVEWLFGIVVTAAIGLISWSLKELYNRIKTDREETKQRIDSVEQKIETITEKIEAKIYAIENKLAEKYVAKPDFYREINKFDMKLDIIQEKLSEVNNSISALVAKGE